MPVCHRRASSLILAVATTFGEEQEEAEHISVYWAYIGKEKERDKAYCKLSSGIRVFEFECIDGGEREKHLARGGIYTPQSSFFSLCYTRMFILEKEEKVRDISVEHCPFFLTEGGAGQRTWLRREHFWVSGFRFVDKEERSNQREVAFIRPGGKSERHVNAVWWFVWEHTHEMSPVY
jgi:hypothetical protein